MTGPGLTYRLLDGGQATARAEEYHGLHAEVYADPPYGQDDEDYPRRFAVQREDPGSAAGRPGIAAVVITTSNSGSRASSASC